MSTETEPDNKPDQDVQREVSSKTFTQEQLDAIISQRLSKERERFAGFDELKSKAGKFDELQEEGRSEQEKMTERLTAAEQRAASAELGLLRQEVAAAKGLPVSWARRLVGATREELEADAAEMVKAPLADVSIDGGARSTTQKLDMNALLRGASGRA